MLKSKIHRARITGAELDYEVSISIDTALLQAADMLPGEQVHMVNLNNGSRIITYIIDAPANSRQILLNGPAARTGRAGDEVAVLSYCDIPDADARSHKLLVVLIDDNNRLRAST